MPEIVQTMVHTFDELDGRAKSRARDWYRQASNDDDWHETVFEDFERIYKIRSINLVKRYVDLTAASCFRISIG